MRERAVSALLALYGARENLNPLHDFTERFSARFSELIYDKDEGVAVKGVSCWQGSVAHVGASNKARAGHGGSERVA